MLARAFPQEFFYVPTIPAAVQQAIGEDVAALAEPGTATTLAAKTGLTRQKVNYHLRALEQHGLVELVEERRKGNCTERVLRATASSYVISPAAPFPPPAT